MFGRDRPMNLAPRASRCRNIGASGSTVTDDSTRGQLADEFPANPGLLRGVIPAQVREEPGAQYGAPLSELDYYVGTGFAKPYVSYGLEMSDRDRALEHCNAQLAKALEVIGNVQ
jgi:hypothetical protein